MSLIIKTAKTLPVRIDIDIDTNAGRIKGYFTGHAIIRSKPELQGFSEELQTLFADADPKADEIVLRRMYERFEGLANESGELDGEAAFREILEGPYSVALTGAAMERYWDAIAGGRPGNSLRRRGR